MVKVNSHRMKKGSVIVFPQSIWKKLKFCPFQNGISPGAVAFSTANHVLLSTVGFDRCIPPAAHALHSCPGSILGSNTVTE